MKINHPEIVRQGGAVQYQFPVQCSDGSEVLTYSLKEPYSELVSELCDAALVALLIPAMTQGEDIHIAGTISEKLFYNASGPLQHVLKVIIPKLHLIKVYPDDVQVDCQRASGVATGFSGGIDSFSVLADHFYGQVPKGYRVTHLLYNNVGSHLAGQERLFRERYQRLTALVRQLELPFVAVNSNLDIFYKGYSFLTTHTPRNASVALLLQQGIGRFLYASAYPYSDTFIRPIEAISHSDPVILPLLSTERLDAILVGAEYTRVEKTIRVSQLKDSYQVLDVCVDDKRAGNCSVCEKCMRTMLTLEMLGVLDRYTGVFDLEAYWRRRDNFILFMLRNQQNSMYREIMNFARECRFQFPLSVRIQSLYPDPAYKVKRAFEILHQKASAMLR